MDGELAGKHRVRAETLLVAKSPWQNSLNHSSRRHELKFCIQSRLKNYHIEFQLRADPSESDSMLSRLSTTILSKDS